ncbi:DoxX family protein [Kouleothrix aurantiaca]|uniref:DoxX family protein n=1 Tax=Kouleothrix aurantiaca TaxID=186479 RepID=A0A0P9DD77_9CHLR|nr:DoxX family protein [Kouleothrix aurantiaca]
MPASSFTRAFSRAALGLGFLAAGANHFRRPRMYRAIMPDYLPWHRELVALSGYAELLLGGAALFPPLRTLTRWGLTALLLAVFPANLHMAMHPERYPQIPRALLWLRLPLQPALIAWVWRTTAEEA